VEFKPQFEKKKSGGDPYSSPFRQMSHRWNSNPSLKRKKKSRGDPYSSPFREMSHRCKAFTMVPDMFLFMLVLFLVFEPSSHYIAQAGLELIM
jgi:hypothetical protein